MAMLSFIKIILAILPFISLCQLNSLLNLNRVNRGHQFLMPVAAMVYCIIAVLFLDKINALLMKLAELVTPASVNINWESIMIYILNSVLIIGFMTIKSILLPILNKIWSSPNVMCATSGIFYKYQDDIDKWVLKKEYANFRGYYKGFYYALLIVSALVFALSREFSSSVFFQAVFYPAFGVLILGEVVYFLSGITKGEFVEDILGEDETSFKVANYGMLRGILRDLYGDRVLYENTLDVADGIEETFDALDSMANSDERMQKTIGMYYKALKANGGQVDINYVKSCFNLLQGRSTLFYNPFYRDLTDYILLPLTKSLISYKKCLIVAGRDSIAEDAKDWIEKGIETFTGTNSLWTAKILDENHSDFDIGILKSCDIYNLKLQQKNSEFLKSVGFVILLEPSRILASGQVGLSLLVNQCESDHKAIVYCACDRNCDGLVDALSHILKTSITEVTATLGVIANTSQMYWKADGKYMHHVILPKISRYLGVGTEINAVAMKYQIPYTSWIGSEKFPVIDMKWIAGQYYKQICDYADLPISQESFSRAFNVDSKIWSCAQRDNAFFVVEDEFQNLFEMTRIFASRAKKQGFINVVSENYLLRDYMLDNADIFEADPKAIPTIVPDYARTERNIVLKLIMMMSNGPVSEEYIEKELMLCGIHFYEAHEILKDLIIKHCNVEDASLTVRFREEIDEDSFNSNVVRHYEINETNALYEYSHILKNAYYIAEDEKGESHYIGAKLYGHIFQVFLPGQFMTFDGKYYEIQTITPLNGVVVRRSADHITGRHYYRQMRNIHLKKWNEDLEMGRKKMISGIEITFGFADISISTDGFLDMPSYGDFKNAKAVKINGIPDRNYRNKSILRIKLPGSSEKVRYTVCLLLNEIFRTTYPNAYPYISAVTIIGECESENLKYGLYSFDGEYEDECIYIIEDSEIDLGLIVSFERNLKRYFEIIADYLSWHVDKMLEKPEEPKPVEEFVPEFKAIEGARKGVFEKISDFFTKLFGKKKKSNSRKTKDEKPYKKEKKTPDSTNSSGSEANKGGNALSKHGCVKRQGVLSKIKFFFMNLFKKKQDDEVPKPLEGSDVQTEREKDTDKEENPLVMNLRSSSKVLKNIEDMDVDGEDEKLVESPQTNLNETEYQKNCFLKFGYDEFSEALDFAETISYLSRYGFNHNPLQQVRGAELDEEIYEKLSNPQKYTVHFCDFCGAELIGGEYDVLNDGRERCNRCSMTAIRTTENFRELFKNVLRNMEMFFGIKINTAIKVRMTDAKKIAKHVGDTFIATPGFDGRTLGFAQKDKTGYSIYLENGSPKLAATATIAHELTHIWQYLNWNEDVLSKQYGKQNMTEVYEGMAKWAEIQYLILLNEVNYAKRQEVITRMRDDVYGHGFIQYAAKYPLSYDTRVKHTPFDENIPL